jgi:uncharacterized membrane protein YphA (DoxX/SURF4 family)
MEPEIPRVVSRDGEARSPQPNRTAWLSVTALIVAGLSILLGFFVAIIAIVLGHIGRAQEPDAKATAGLALVVGYVSAVLHGLFFLGAAILAHSLRESNWQF